MSDRLTQIAAVVAMLRNGQIASYEATGQILEIMVLSCDICDPIPKFTPEERKEMAREIFDIGKRGLTQALASAPQILFVAAAGNSNSDATFNESMPADIVLPNLLTVGAVDRAGDEAPFTSYGPTVKVHANGYQVESLLPGGARVALSGTSMAAPQVTNLAAKLLVLNPKLTTAQLIEAIVGSAEKTADGRRVLMHPKKAAEAVQSRR